MTHNKLSFKEVYLQGLPIKHLTSSFLKGRISQTYLFTGEDSVGKQKVAHIFSALLQCKNHITSSSGLTEPCGNCNSCKRIIANSHPDVNIISTSGNDIRIDQIRELTNEAFLKPSLGEWKIYIIDPANKLNIPSSNALLKTLEEAPQQTIFILITTGTNSLLPTILSRSEIVKFQSPSYNETRDILSSKMGLNKKDAAQCLGIAEGSFGQAISFAKNYAPPTPVLGIKHGHTSFLTDLERYAETVTEKFQDIESLELAVKQTGNFSKLNFIPLQVSRKELCRSIIMQVNMPASFPILFTQEFSSRLDAAQKRILKSFDAIVRDSKSSYSSAMLKEIEKQFSSELKTWKTNQFTKFLSCLLHWYEDVFRWMCTEDETLLLNLEQKKDIITLAEIDEITSVRSYISLLNESINLLDRHVQPTLILENVLTQIGGLQLE